jgi:hypothetical protein
MYHIACTTLTREYGPAIDVTIVFPCEKKEQGDEHEHPQNTGNELPDSHSLAPSAIANGLEVIFAADSTQWAAIAGLARHLSRPFVGTAISDACVDGGRDV